MAIANLTDDLMIRILELLILKIFDEVDYVIFFAIKEKVFQIN